MVGGALVWFAGAVLEWQRDLAFTLGVSRSLLPFGDQLGLLRWVQATWFVVIPGIGLFGGLAAAILGGLVGGLLAAAYNRSPRHALVVVELPDDASRAPVDDASRLPVDAESDPSPEERQNDPGV
jgi:hypothetical protein